MKTKQMTYDEVCELMSADGETDLLDKSEDNALDGLMILRRLHQKGDVICGAGHDIIYSIFIDEAIKGGITPEDCNTLRRLNWMIEHESFACFV